MLLTASEPELLLTYTDPSEGFKGYLAIDRSNHAVAAGGFRVGFPNATQVDPDWLLELVLTAVKTRAKRIAIYDTNGSTDPFRIFELMDGMVREIAVGPLSPVTGDYAFSHKSPGHLEVPELFEAYDPKLVGRKHELESDV